MEHATGSRYTGRERRNHHLHFFLFAGVRIRQISCSHALNQFLNFQFPGVRMKSLRLPCSDSGKFDEPTLVALDHERHGQSSLHRRPPRLGQPHQALHAQGGFHHSRPERGHILGPILILDVLYGIPQKNSVRKKAKIDHHTTLV